MTDFGEQLTVAGSHEDFYKFNPWRAPGNSPVLVLKTIIYSMKFIVLWRFSTVLGRLWTEIWSILTQVRSMWHGGGLEDPSFQRRRIRAFS